MYQNLHFMEAFLSKGRLFYMKNGNPEKTFKAKFLKSWVSVEFTTCINQFIEYAHLLGEKTLVKKEKAKLKIGYEDNKKRLAALIEELDQKFQDIFEIKD